MFVCSICVRLCVHACAFVGVRSFVLWDRTNYNVILHQQKGT